MNGEFAKHGMPPIGARRAQLLILGSLPGDESIRQQRYYAHPQNQFWRILGAVFNEPHATTDYLGRLALLERHHIVVWDVLRNAIRRGSLDAAITAPIGNDFADFFAREKHITSIAFNGQKAAALFKSFVVDADVIARTRQLRIATLPSTSPAAVTLKIDQKIELWRAFLTGETNKINPVVTDPAAAQRSGSISRR